MKWPLKRNSIPKSEIPFFNLLFLGARGGGPDSTIVWTSEVAWEPLCRFIDQYNEDNDCLIGTSAVLVQAVGQALAKHEELNRRVVGRRIFEFADRSVCLATRKPRSNEVNVVAIDKADKKSVRLIAGMLWERQLEFHRNDSPYLRDRNRLQKLPFWMFRLITKAFQWLETVLPVPVLGRMDRLKETPVLVNDFSHPKFPVMRGYKPSRQPDESKPLNVTLGRAEERLVMESGQPTVRKFAPICVRADHRICDTFQLSQFVATLIKSLENPQTMQEVVLKMDQQGRNEIQNQAA